jgi:hypothetical protein
MARYGCSHVRLVTLALAVIALLLLACGSGTTDYRVTVSFDETVTQDDMDAVDEYLRSFDDELDFLIQESFPPTGVATLSTDEDDFCPTVVAELESRSYVRSVDCREASDEPVESPDAPVSSEPVTTPT